MKKTLTFIVVLIITLALAIPAFAQGEEDGATPIYPWLIPEDEYGNRIITVSPDEDILLGARWGACTKGLAQAWSKTAGVAYSVDGVPLFTSEKDSRQYWSRPAPAIYIFDPEEICVNNTDTFWYVYWEYMLGRLDAGDYPVHFEYWNDHVVRDGGDYDGDGKADKFKDWSLIVDFIIHVE